MLSTQPWYQQVGRVELPASGSPDVLALCAAALWHPGMPAPRLWELTFPAEGPKGAEAPITHSSPFSLTRSRGLGETWQSLILLEG